MNWLLRSHSCHRGGCSGNILPIGLSESITENFLMTWTGNNKGKISQLIQTQLHTPFYSVYRTQTSLSCQLTISLKVHQINNPAILGTLSLTFVFYESTWSFKWAPLCVPPFCIHTQYIASWYYVRTNVFMKHLSKNKYYLSAGVTKLYVHIRQIYTVEYSYWLILTLWFF